MSNVHTDHRQFEYLLPDLAAGTLGSSESELVNAHLAQCQHCSARLQEFQQIMAKLSTAKGSDHVPEGYFANIVPRFRDRIAKPGDGLFGIRWLQLVPPAAALIIMVGVLSAIRPATEMAETNGLKSLALELEAAELTDAFLSEVDHQLISSLTANDALAGTLSKDAVSRELLVRMADAPDLPLLQTFDDLENEELDVLLQRLQSRKYL